MDCTNVANTALMTKIKKDKTLSDLHPFVSAELASNALVLAPSGTAAAKAQSRILSSKWLAPKVLGTVAALNNFLHPNPGARRILEGRDKSAFPNVGTKSRTDQARNSVIVNDSDEGYSIGSDKDLLSEVNDGDGWESGTVSDNDHEPSAKSDGWESGSIQGGSYREQEMSDALSDVGGLPSGPGGMEIKPKNSTSLSNGQSAFLPTLSVGFTRGDSDSEFSDREAKISDSGKKNRRGQRARRASVFFISRYRAGNELPVRRQDMGKEIWKER